jgi:hypothetical protein
MGWGADVADLDNDGDLDVVVVFGAMGDEPGQPDAVFRQDNVGQFTSVGEEWGLADETTGRGLILADLDHNGWMDIVRPNLAGEGTVDLSPCGSNSWLEVALLAPPPNTRGIGAVVRVITDTHSQQRSIYAGGTSYASGGPPEVHLGLGNATTADIEITWADGQVARFEDLSTRQRVVIERAR